MKKFGLVMAVIFILCALGTQPVSAQEPEYGYVPLLSEGYDTSIPRQLVSRESFERMLPRLMDAKAKGIITDFEPDFYGGFVRVTSSSATLRGGTGTFPVKANMWDAFVRPPMDENQGVTRGAISFHAYFYNFSSCFNVYSEAGYRIVGSLKTAAGELIGVSDDYISSSGYLSDCFTGPFTSTNPGFKIAFKVYDSVGTYITTYSTVVPRNTFKTIDKTNGIVTGTAPAGLQYEVSWWHNNQDAGNTYSNQYFYGTVPASGSWSADFTKPFKGADWIDIYLDRTDYFTFDYYFAIPRLSCGLRSYTCYLTGIPNKPVEMTITHAGKTYKFSGLTSRTGYFYAYLYDSYGDPLMLASGDKITGTGASLHTLPVLTMTVNRLANTITGKAPASRYFWVDFYPWNGSTWYGDWTQANSSGLFTSDFSWTDIPATGIVLSELNITIPTTGNSTWLRKVTP